MRSYILIFLAVFLTIAGGGAVIGWFVQATHTKVLVENAIAEFNKGPARLTHSGIKAWGFPLTLNVSVIKPRLQIGVGEQWIEDIALDGDVTVGVNALSDTYMLAANGGWQRRVTLAGKETAIVGKSDGDLFFCHLRLTRGMAWLSTQLWDIEKLRERGENFLDDLRRLDCIAPGTHTVSDPKTGALLMQSGPGRFYIDREPGKNGAHTVRLYLDSGETEVSAQGDGILFANDAPAVSGLHVLGKMRMEIDVTYRGNRDFTDGDWTVDRLDFLTAPYGIAAQGGFTRQPNQPLPSGRLTLRCIHCPELVDSVTAYIADARKLVPELAAAPTLPEENLKAFLRALAGPEAGDDFIYAIAGGEAGITVNGKPLEEVMAMYQQTMKTPAAPPKAKPAQ